MSWVLGFNTLWSNALVYSILSLCLFNQLFWFLAGVSTFIFLAFPRDNIFYFTSPSFLNCLVPCPWPQEALWANIYLLTFEYKLQKGREWKLNFLSEESNFSQDLDLMKMYTIDHSMISTPWQRPPTERGTLTTRFLWGSCPRSPFKRRNSKRWCIARTVSLIETPITDTWVYLLSLV